MKATELIRKLQEQVDKHGDVEVMFWECPAYLPLSFERVQYFPNLELELRAIDGGIIMIRR